MTEKESCRNVSPHTYMHIPHAHAHAHASKDNVKCM